jgi:hypothetical protein
MKSAVVNKETTIVENIIVADPNDNIENPYTYLVLIPDNLPVDMGYTYINNFFYDKDGIEVKPFEEQINGN